MIQTKRKFLLLSKMQLFTLKKKKTKKKHSLDLMIPCWQRNVTAFKYVV